MDRKRVSPEMELNRPFILVSDVARTRRMSSGVVFGTVYLARLQYSPCLVMRDVWSVRDCPSFSCG